MVGAEDSSWTTEICAAWTVMSMAAASGADDTSVGVGAGGSVMVGRAPPITTVLPSERTVTCPVGEDTWTAAPV